MIKTETKVFNAYKADEHIKYYIEQGIKSHFIFEYHNQPLNENGLVNPQGTWKSLKPIRPKDDDLDIKYKYELNYKEKTRLSVLDTKIQRTEKLIRKLKSEKSKLEKEILDEVLQDFDYESIYEGDYWDCHLSPVGYCIYTNDFGEPECIFCGEPEERK